MPTVTVNNHEIYYADSHPDGAPANGSTFIFIHGLGSSQNYYFPILPYLETQHRCIALDTYGSARSTYTGQPVSIESIAADVVGVLDALKVAQAVVVGHSMGGLVVTLLGAQYADRVKAVVAIGPTHPSDKLASVMTQRSETVSNCKPLLGFSTKMWKWADCQLSGHGAHGQHHPQRRHRHPLLAARQSPYPRVDPGTEPQGLRGALPGDRQSARHRLRGHLGPVPADRGRGGQVSLAGGVSAYFRSGVEREQEDGGSGADRTLALRRGAGGGGRADSGVCCCFVVLVGRVVSYNGWRLSYNEST